MTMKKMRSAVSVGVIAAAALWIGASGLTHAGELENAAGSDPLAAAVDQASELPRLPQGGFVKPDQQAGSGAEGSAFYPMFQRVLVEINLPLLELEQQMGILQKYRLRLSDSYGIIWDWSYKPVPMRREMGEGRTTYLVVGRVHPSQMAAMRQSWMVHSVELDSGGEALNVDQETLQAFVRRHKLAISSVPGVSHTHVGQDCPGDPMQRRPCWPSIIITLRPEADKTAVRQELLKRFPDLGRLPLLLVNIVPPRYQP